MNILVLFAGAGLSTRGLLNVGHSCVDVEYDKDKSYLSSILNPEASHLIGDVRDLSDECIAQFDAVWASPPCQFWSGRRNAEWDIKETTGDLLLWTLDKYRNRLDKNQVWWIENVIPQATARRDAVQYLKPFQDLLTFGNTWQYGRLWNAAQFLDNPVQKRRRIVAGNYAQPHVYRKFKYNYPKLNIPPALLALFYKRKPQPEHRKNGYVDCGVATFFGEFVTLEMAAKMQGVNIPSGWYDTPEGFTKLQWEHVIAHGLGNGVPVYMAEAFGRVYSGA